DGALVNVDDFVDLLDPIDALTQCGHGRIGLLRTIGVICRLAFVAAAVRPTQLFAQCAEQYVIHERTFARAADSCDANELAERYIDRTVSQVMVASADDG